MAATSGGGINAGRQCSRAGREHVVAQKRQAQVRKRRWQRATLRLLDDGVDGFAHFRRLAAHRQLHGHVAPRIDAKRQPHHNLAGGRRRRRQHAGSVQRAEVCAVGRCKGNEPAARRHEHHNQRLPLLPTSRQPQPQPLPSTPPPPAPTCTSPTSVPASSSVWLRALGGTASVPSHACMPRMRPTASTASCGRGREEERGSISRLRRMAPRG